MFNLLEQSIILRKNARRYIIIYIKIFNINDPTDWIFSNICIFVSKKQKKTMTELFNSVSPKIVQLSFFSHKLMF